MPSPTGVRNRLFQVAVAFLAMVMIASAARSFADDATIRIGDTAAELTINQISDRTVHIELSPLDETGKPCPEPATAVFVPFQRTEKLRIRQLPAAQELAVGQLHVTVKPSPLTVSVARANGTIVQELAFDPNDASIRFRTEAPVYGMGEGRQQFDRRGFYYNFANGQNALLRTHGATVPVPFLLGADGWGLFIHNPSVNTATLTGQAAMRDANIPWGRFDLRGDNAGPPTTGRDVPTTAPAVLPTRGKYIPRRETLAHSPIQLFAMDLTNPTDAFTEYTHLTGQPAMPPKWAMGYIQSHRSLAGPAEPIQVAQTMRDHQLPCDAVIYLGSGYTNDRDGLSGWNMGHGSLTFNPRTFDKPQEMIDKLHDLHFKIILHKNAAPAGLYGSVNDPASDDPQDISNYWATHLTLMKMGIDAWWPDDGDELPIESRLARLRLYYDGPLKDRPNERPWSLDRNGYAGAARYGAWIWSGDVTSLWSTLANHVKVGVNFSMSVSPWWGTDIGGFVSSSEYTGELYARWFEFAAFTPLFRSHGRNWHLHTPFGWNTGDVGPIESRPAPPESAVHNADVEPACKKFLELRYRLLPYNYTITRQAADSGVPPMRSLWLHYPEDATAATIGDEYLWGRDILVAPVVEKGAQTRRLYLPPGTWYDWWTDERSPGQKWVDRNVDLAMIPLYVRAGAIVPLDPIRQYTSQAVDGPTTLRVYPGADGAFTLYDDDGHTMAYRDGTDASTVWIQFHWDDAGHRLTIEPDARMPHLPGGERVFEAQLAGSQAKPVRVVFHGEKVDTRLD
jgi:alpha-glucosidase/alpha-D-xyloside xylohydrolase